MAKNLMTRLRCNPYNFGHVWLIRVSLLIGTQVHFAWMTKYMTHMIKDVPHNKKIGVVTSTTIAITRTFYSTRTTSIIIIIVMLIKTVIIIIIIIIIIILFLFIILSSIAQLLLNMLILSGTGFLQFFFLNTIGTIFIMIRIIAI